MHQRALTSLGLALLLSSTTLLPALAAPEGKAPPAGKNLYGAIAFDKRTRAYGFSFDHRTRAAAEARAVSECASGGCQSMMWFANGCGALATSRERYGAATGASRREAERKALQQCTASDCRVLTWSCTAGAAKGGAQS